MYLRGGNKSKGMRIFPATIGLSPHFYEFFLACATVQIKALAGCFWQLDADGDNRQGCCDACLFLLAAIRPFKGAQSAEELDYIVALIVRKPCSSMLVLCASPPLSR